MNQNEVLTRVGAPQLSQAAVSPTIRPYQRQRDTHGALSSLEVMPTRGAARSRGEQRADDVPARGTTRLFALTVPGMATLLAHEIDGTDGLTSTEAGNDGRADVVLFDAGRGARGSVQAIRAAEDVFVEVGRARRADGDDPRQIGARVWQSERVERALSVWAEQVRPLSAGMSYRVIARVLREQSFQRTDLRRELSRVVGTNRPRWKTADPATLEVWIVEYAPGKLVAGLRLTDVSKRQGGGRAIERPGALRPSVAAAMVDIAGPPGGVLLDPCCGSGTILAQALTVGWQATGSDIDAEAVRIAQQNVPAATISQDDVRKLPLADGSMSACVSNLPFGRQYGVEGPMHRWQLDAVAEMVRVSRSGSRIVLLVPELPNRGELPGVRLSEQHALRLLGVKTAIWVLDRI
jgi:23S rRNA G2445 N2-methylase RlmL